MDFAENHLTDDTSYVAVFLPGGHGAMLGLSGDGNLGKVLRWAHERALYTLAICHGPAALLAANDEEPFIYLGYKVAAFPDAVDKQTPMIGYMPGHMPWKFGEKLNALGVTVINTKAGDSCHTGRCLISGASPKAANAFGRLAAETLLDAVHSGPRHWRVCAEIHLAGCARCLSVPLQWQPRRSDLSVRMQIWVYAHRWVG